MYIDASHQHRTRPFVKTIHINGLDVKHRAFRASFVDSNPGGPVHRGEGWVKCYVRDDNGKTVINPDTQKPVVEVRLGMVELEFEPSNLPLPPELPTDGQPETDQWDVLIPEPKAEQPKGA